MERPNYAFNLFDPDALLDGLIVPPELCTEIDISIGASEEFIKLSNEIERLRRMGKYPESAQKALEALKDKKQLIDYPTLKLALKSPKNIDPETGRWLYLIERSIPPRSKDRYSWVQRLKIFVNTYTYEHTVEKAQYRPFLNDPLKGGKLYFRKGSARNPIDHENLRAGRGNFGADFYFYDKSQPKGQEMQSVEFKYNPKSSVEAGVDYVQNNDQTYDANYLIMYDNSSQKFYWVDLITGTYSETSIPAPPASEIFEI